jgi:hypothetical protein
MFATPDAFCSELYSNKELKMYETTLITGKPLLSPPPLSSPFVQTSTNTPQTAHPRSKRPTKWAQP